MRLFYLVADWWRNRLTVSTRWREQHRRAEMKTTPEAIAWKWPVVKE